MHVSILFDTIRGAETFFIASFSNKIEEVMTKPGKLEARTRISVHIIFRDADIARTIERFFKDGTEKADQLTYSPFCSQRDQR